MDSRIKEGTYVRVPLIGAHGHKFTAQAHVDEIDFDTAHVSIGGDKMTFRITSVTHEPLENVYPELFVK